MTAMNESLGFFSINDGASFSDEDLIVAHTVNLTHFFRIVQYMGLMNFFLNFG
jgi:Cu2+-containing amine oxidase